MRGTFARAESLDHNFGRQPPERAALFMLCRGEMSQWRFYKKTVYNLRVWRGPGTAAPHTRILYPSTACTRIGGFICIACCTE